MCFYSYFQDLYTALLLNQDDLRLRCERYFDILESSSPVLVFTDVVREFYSGLASYKIYRETHDLSWLQKGKGCKENILLWTEQGSLQHFQHNKYLLLEAEEAFCINKIADARNLYKEAITSAEAHQFLNEVALAAECAANFYYEIGDKETSFENLCLLITNTFRGTHMRRQTSCLKTSVKSLPVSRLLIPLLPLVSVLRRRMLLSRHH